MKRRNPERDIQIAVADHIRLRGIPGLVWFHVPNAPRNAITGKLFKRMGMRAGVSDLILFHKKELFALELKAPGGKASESQFNFLSDIKINGGEIALAEGIDEALCCLETWGLIR